MSRRAIPRGERGAALLAVLILVAITGAIAAAALEKLRLSRLLSSNVIAIDQARHFGAGAEQLGTLIIDDLLMQDRTKTTLVGGWNGATRTIPMPGGGAVEARLRDGGNCFNINSVVQGSAREGLSRRPSGVAQFSALMLLSGVPAGDAQRIAEAAADWVDSDIETAPAGAEDGAYSGGEQPYRTGNTLFADPSELRALLGMRAEHYARIRPFICTLPTADLSPINVNTLLPHQAILLAMLAPGRLTEPVVARILATRPPAGWNNPTEFWRNEALSALGIPLDAQQQVQVRTDWFLLDIRATVEQTEFFQTSLVDARLQPSKVVQRRWERDGADALPLTEGR
ncbi:MAG TPA: type II secretion system minor pseudopilin GspK [Allosphingosinicella sp.]|nr:type II secretion system minor pseudopilin GspK [Allosphingosinicella sp.]